MPFRWNETGFPTIDVPQPLCLRMPGFQQVNVTAPDGFISGPHAVVDAMLPDALGKTYVEFGERVGEISNCMAQFASKVTVIEFDPEQCAYLLSRGLNVLCTKIDGANVITVLPLADVYHWWTSPRGYERFAKFVNTRVLRANRTAIIYIDFPPLRHEVKMYDMAHYCKLFQRWYGVDHVSMKRIILPRHPTLNFDTTDDAVRAKLSQEWLSRPIIDGRMLYHQLRIEVGPWLLDPRGSL